MNLKSHLWKRTSTRWRRLSVEALLTRARIQSSSWLSQSDESVHQTTLANDLKALKTRKSVDMSQTIWSSGLNLLSSNKKNYLCQWVWTNEPLIAFKKLIGRRFGSKMPLSRLTTNLTSSKSWALSNLKKVKESLQRDECLARTLLAIQNWSSLRGRCLSLDFLPSRRKVSLLWRCSRIVKALTTNSSLLNSQRVWSISDQSIQN